MKPIEFKRLINSHTLEEIREFLIKAGGSGTVKFVDYIDIIRPDPPTNEANPEFTDGTPIFPMRKEQIMDEEPKLSDLELTEISQKEKEERS